MRTVHGASTSTNAATNSAADATPTRTPRSRAILTSTTSPRMPANIRYSGRVSAVAPSIAPGSSHAHVVRPGSAAQKIASTAADSVNAAIGSLRNCSVLSMKAG